MSEKIYSISNGTISIEVSSIGAQMKTLKDNCGFNYIWTPDPAFWGKTAPVLFPICGSVLNETYIHGGKEYHLSRHGFISTSEFTLTEQSASSLTFTFNSNKDSLKVYPFTFSFSVKFEIIDASLQISYITTNKSDEPMYFSVGAHEAYSCPEGIEEYDVVFEKPEELIRTIIDGPYYTDLTEKVETDGNALHMKYSHMDNDSLVFEKINSKSVCLKNRKTGRGVKVDFADFKHFVLWTKKNAPYLCIEPWNGLSDHIHHDMILKNKKSIIELLPGDTFSCTHTITPIKAHE